MLLFIFELFGVMFMHKNIVLITDNQFKKREISELLSDSGIKLSLIQSKSELHYENTMKELGIDECYFIREETYLEDYDGNKIDIPDNLQALNHVSNLTILFAEKKKKLRYRENKYTAKVSGFIDHSRMKKDRSDIYNWDDIFVNSKTMQTYHEMKDVSGKHSARSQVVSLFIKNHLGHKNLDYNYNPFKQDFVIDFSDNIYNLIDKNKYLSLHKKSPILNSLMKSVYKNGLFTKAASSKPERNYWFPALNAGLPITPKSDEIHEITFLFHDLMHHVIPDLIIDDFSHEFSKDAYIIHRMMSEAITIVLADMIFIDVLSKEGVNYDWSKRNIYPLYQSMKIDNIDDKKLKELLWANISFALLGDYKPLLNMSNEATFEKYRSIYEKFFIEDYRWTINNFHSMKSRSDTIESWFSSNKIHFEKSRTVSHFANLLNEDMAYKEKVRAIFDRVWTQIDCSIKSQEPIISKEKSISNAFKNYMIGQSFIFFDFDFVDSSKTFHDMIYNNYIASEKIHDQLSIKKARDLFSLYVDMLTDQHRIHHNFNSLYKKMVPFFPPFFVFYDSDLQYNCIRELLEDKSFI